MSVKGLHKIIYPFAPDQSGAAAVLYELGGMIIICDAGGCAGNVCGFDEPRWLSTKSAIFSAGLRDMDAILGRDDLLIEKIKKASAKIDAKFVAVIGTPVPATIATDYKALRRMAEKRTGLPVITIDSNGVLWYDSGIEKTYLECFRRFTAEDNAKDIIPGSVGVIGVTPLDSDSLSTGKRIAETLRKKGSGRVVCYGAGGSLEDFADAGRMEKNIVVAASGLKAAGYLKEKFGTPYECTDPLIADVRAGLPLSTEELCGKKILIIHQQVRANALREALREETGGLSCAPEITAATWFSMFDEIAEEGDFRIREESDFFDRVRGGNWDIIIADGSFRKAAGDFGGRFIELPHFAVSGHFTDEESVRFYT
jgi:hypothetical protein